MQREDYDLLLSAIKENIGVRRYNAARLANREQLLLYYAIGKMLSQRVAAASWGDSLLKRISADLQKGIPGLRGFSPQNLKKMRQFYEAYSEMEEYLIGSAVPSQLPNAGAPTASMATFIETFLSIGFTHHYGLLKITDTAERWYYMHETYRNQWGYRVMEQAIAARRYHSRGRITNNFAETLPPTVKDHAIEAFRDNYLLNFIATDPETERDLERSIVDNIKEFILGLGTGFVFIGNQYRVLLGEDEYYIDLLFFNRALQSLVAFELKLDKFKPEHAGQMNFYLSVLDDKVKLPHENPSIGIILCRQKDNTAVEYAIRGISSPMGVATYQLLPETLKNVLPAPDDLERIMKQDGED